MSRIRNCIREGTKFGIKPREVSSRNYSGGEGMCHTASLKGCYLEMCDKLRASHICVLSS